MPDIPVHNETTFELAPWIMSSITNEMIEYFGEDIRAIRVQSGIYRHTLNTKTREVRFAFDPGDYALNSPMMPYGEVDADELGMVWSNSQHDLIRPGEHSDDPDEAATALIMMDEALDTFDADLDTDFQGLDPDFDTPDFDVLETSDDTFLNKSYNALDQE